MRLLLTGVPGWLGNRFVHVLLQEDEPSWPKPPATQLRLLVLPQADLATVRPLLDGAEIVTGDLRDPTSLPRAMEGIECVVHLAGIIHPRSVREFYAINTEGTRHLVAAAIAAGVRRFISVSSNSVAGCNPSRDRLMTEDDKGCPYLHYGRSKWLAENLVNEAGQRGVLETVILRPCWYYGPWQPARQTRFFRMIKKGRPILFGDGTNLRSLTYLDNLCQALLLAIATARAAGQTYWIADERPYTMLEIYQTLARLLEVRRLAPCRLPDLISEGCLLADRILQGVGLYVPEIHMAGELNKTIACSIEKAKRELGYHPTVALEEGMRRSIEWCQAHGILL